MTTPNIEIDGLMLRDAQATTEDCQLVEALRRGEEPAFVSLLNQYHVPMRRLAMVYVSDAAVAEEVVQETWMAVVTGVGRFEARSSLKTWIFSILTNCAKSRGKREGRTIPFSALWNAPAESEEHTVDPACFNQDDVWAVYPQRWDRSPEDRLLSGEMRRHVLQAIATLPPSQREVVTLRDIDGWSAAEVCGMLGVTEANQRVLLHRGRSRVRRALEEYFNEADNNASYPA